MNDRVSREVRSRMMSRVRRAHTAPEMTVRRLLHHLGYRFRLQRKDLPGRPDVVLPGRRTAIFVHGCFWHGHDCAKGHLPRTNVAFWSTKIDRNRERDASVRASLESSGWRVHVVWECELRDQARLAGELTALLGPIPARQSN
jgi:DNA mismatch endonuclease, patch repair protein